MIGCFTSETTVIGETGFSHSVDRGFPPTNPAACMRTMPASLFGDAGCSSIFFETLKLWAHPPQIDADATFIRWQFGQGLVAKSAFVGCFSPFFSRNSCTS